MKINSITIATILFCGASSLVASAQTVHTPDTPRVSYYHRMTRFFKKDPKKEINKLEVKLQEIKKKTALLKQQFLNPVRDAESTKMLADEALKTTKQFQGILSSQARLGRRTIIGNDKEKIKETLVQLKKEYPEFDFKRSVENLSSLAASIADDIASFIFPSEKEAQASVDHYLRWMKFKSIVSDMMFVSAITILVATSIVGIL